MGTEIERKFLVDAPGWDRGPSSRFRQGYLNTDRHRTVRVRTVDETGYLTIKGPTRGTARLEFEYEIPFQDATEMLDALCERPLIEKVRHRVEYSGNVWEIDEFLGRNAGLVLAEIELQTAEERFDKPPWLGPEVTGDPRYYNANLIARPYDAWPRETEAPVSA